MDFIQEFLVYLEVGGFCCIGLECFECFFG